MNRLLAKVKIDIEIDCEGTEYYVDKNIPE